MQAGFEMPRGRVAAGSALRPLGRGRAAVEVCHPRRPIAGFNDHTIMPIAFSITARAISWFGNNDERTFATSRGNMRTRPHRALRPRVECSVTTVLIDN